MYHVVSRSLRSRLLYTAPFAPSIAPYSTALFLRRPRLCNTNPARRNPLYPRFLTSATLTSPPSTNFDAMSHNKPSPGGLYRGEILCNRALNMAGIEAVGFDMDYTLAEYYSEAFESLSARGALEKLVSVMGYPEKLLNIEYDHDYFIRGLIVDKKRGNIIKLDRHKYCKHAMHGFTPMSKTDRMAVYDTITTKGAQFSEPDFAVLDTIFSLPDAYLYAAVVAFKDENPGEISYSYERIYNDVRKAVDLCHRDGYIKDEVRRNPSKYIKRDPRMVSMLERFRRSGRKVFLLTNSLYDYTDAVMRFLYTGPDAPYEEASKWTDLFDVIIAGSCKPAFMLDTRRELYIVDPEKHTLTNTEFIMHGQTADDYMAVVGKTFQGGNFLHLHDLLGVSSGTKVLYVGDHMFSDILRSKRTLGWRTMLIVPELEHEINVQQSADTLSIEQEIAEMRLKRDEFDDKIDQLHLRMLDGESSLEGELQRIRGERERVRSRILELDEQHHKKYHKVWGQLFKTGQQNSRFALQVENYACLYSSSVCNLDKVSPEMYYRAMPDLMVHDRFKQNPIRTMFARRPEKF